MVSRSSPKLGGAFSRALTYFALATISLFMLLPFFWMVSTSLKIDAEIFTPGIKWIPSQLDWENYTYIFRDLNMEVLFRNTIFVTLIAVVAQIILCSMAGFAFARLHFRGRDVLFLAVLITMTVPFEVLVLPLFILIRRFPFAGGNDLLGNGGIGLMNSYAGIVFPHLVTVYGIFIFRQFFLGFPKELEDAARIDGASRLRIYWSLLMPNSAPVVGTMGLFAFLWAWNDLLWPVIVVKENSMKTLQAGLAIVAQNPSRWGEMMAASVIITLPVIFVFLLLQRFLVQGVATSGLKG
ncbi:MAG: carbohydrate ABC transporter permease [Anaerolineales bacterium]|nr:carbohydrate ABC transporter permease [Anaerolineales bacterium]